MERLSATPNVAAAMSEWALSLDIDTILPAIQRRRSCCIDEMWRRSPQTRSEEERR
jgi:hypothetical protein